jgi:hypothetical protein
VAGIVIGTYTLLVGEKFSVIRLAVMSGLSLFD